MKEVFVVVGKKPERGVSKTRLSQSVGEEKALKIYEAFLKDFFTRLKIHTSFPILFFGSSNDGSGQSYFKELFNKLECHDIKYFDQPIGGLMERLTNIFKRVEKDYPGVFVHLTGTDIPDFPFKYLHEIDYEKVNLGPDDDGGYYYVGTKAKNHFLFELPAHLEGSESLLDKTKILIRNKNMGLQEIPNWSDIDTLSDLKFSLKRSGTKVIPYTHRAYFSSLKDSLN